MPNLNRTLLAEFFVEGRPVPQERAGSNRGRRYDPPRSSAWKEKVAWAARQAMDRPPTDKAVEVTCRFWKEGVKVEVWILPDVVGYGLRGDVDNYSKAIFDGCEGIVFENDKQIVLQTTAKFQMGGDE